MHQFSGWQELDPEIRGKDDRDEPGGNQRQADRPENSASVLAGHGSGEADGHEAGHRHRGASQHRKSRRCVGEGRRLSRSQPCSSLRTIKLDGNDRIVDEQTERND